MARQRRPAKQLEWNASLAYAVGLLVTDGSLSKDGRHIIYTSKDADLIETFQACIHFPSKRGVTRNPRATAFRLQVSDVGLYRWLLSIGLSPRKTYHIGAVDVPDEFFIDFLRGHLDGDGSITTYLDTYNTRKNPRYVYTRVWVRFISASKQHLEWLQASVTKRTGLHGRLHTAYAHDSKRVPMYILKFGKRESLALLRAIYYNDTLPCLERKRKIAYALLKKFNM